MFTKKIILLFFIFHSFYVKAQQTADSTLASHPRSIDFVLNFDSRQSFISSGSQKIFDIGLYGFKAGIDFKKRFRAGLGYYDMLSSLYIPYQFQGSSYILDIHFRCATIYGEYVFYHTYKWDVSIPVQYGYSFTSVRKRSSDETILTERIDHYNLVEASVSGYYRIWKWIGIGTGAGYRYMLEKEPIVKDFFNNPVWILRLKIYPVELFKRRSCKVAF